ncbi:hypothetical protein FLL45_09265 [Aliikangiella marina]|uniref:histidine kinase n=1 Tax=Aliikangiella marina TaxID=1712262 RepID=A0A545TD62_9GAMM|nr:ATP-binding protein [Aliikangiella marina]TQV75116.1 hypothetical protein FLL45_09265 [Aliikangiella marina]
MNLAKQIFVRFYLVIIVSVIIIGLTIDYLWRSVEEHNDPPEVALLNVAANSLDNSTQRYQAQIEQLNANTGLNFTLVPLEQISGAAIQKKLTQGEVVFLQSTDMKDEAYRLISGSEMLVRLSIDRNEISTSRQYGLLALFYLLIAVIVYAWTRPLVRDLKRLEAGVTNFADSEWDTVVSVAENSPVSHLANTYNALVVRIKQLLNDQQEMSHAISHELRTPLARIKFSLEIASETTNKSDIAIQLSSISEDVIEMQNLVDDLLSYASLEKASTVAKLERGNIQSLVENLAEKLKRNAPHISLDVATDKSQQTIYCDSYLIERALQNLIINGLKHASQRVAVSMEFVNKQCKLIVEDDGEGIDQAQKERVFDSFVRLPDKHKTKGFGLGLAIVKRIAKLHRGRVYLEDSSLGGAKFIFEWPITDK